MVRKAFTLAATTVLSVSLLSGAAMAAGPKFTAGADGIGDPYYPQDGNGGYDVGQYGLDLRYDPATDRLNGVATIDAKATQNLSRFDFDFQGLTVRSITINGTAAHWHRVGNELVIDPAAGILSGSSFRTVVTYDGVPVTLDDFGVSGFIHTDDGAIVIGEPHVAATWFPANDHPRDKASFTYKIAVPAGLEAVSNGALLGSSTSGGWTTWRWDAVEPMTTYLAFMAIGQFDMTSRQQAGIKYWDAIDSSLFGDLLHAIAPKTGQAFLYSQVADGVATYKRLTRTIAVPPGGATLAFAVDRDTEQDWDHLFVEAHTVGQDDWTTLPDANGHTNQDLGACPWFFDGQHPFMTHYLTPVVLDNGDIVCDPVGTTGAWNAISGSGVGWEAWSVAIPNGAATTRNVEVSIAYQSDTEVQGRGVAIDDIVVSTGQGTTSFESDGNVMDGWVVASAPEGSLPNENSWIITNTVAAVPNTVGPSARTSLDHEASIIGWESNTFGKYPWSTAGGVVDAVDVGFALENQTRPTYSPLFFFEPNDYVVVHELAHQWYGDSLAVDQWKDVWLNEGFATYAEWLWGEKVGDGTVQDNFDFWSGFADGDFPWTIDLADPGIDRLFDFEVYIRGAMTLHALRQEIGDRTFFRLLKEWASRNAGKNVSTEQFIALAESLSGKQLDGLFAEWFGPGRPASLPPPDNGEEGGAAATRVAAGGAPSLATAPAASRQLAIRLKTSPGNPYGVGRHLKTVRGERASSTSKKRARPIGRALNVEVWAFSCSRSWSRS